MSLTDYVNGALAKTRHLSPAWLGAIAGAAAAAATVVPDNRLLGAALAGGAVWLLAIDRMDAQLDHAAEPCCAGCAAGEGCSGASSAEPKAAPEPQRWGEWFEGAGGSLAEFVQSDPMAGGGCR